MTYKTILNEPFNPDKFVCMKDMDERILNEFAFLNKPCGGLWGCPVNAQYSWEKFDDGYFMEEKQHHYLYEFKESARIYVIDNYKDLYNLWKKYPFKLTSVHFDRNIIDFVSVGEDYDAIYLTEKGLLDTRYMSIFTKDRSIDTYSWDVESISIYIDRI